MPDVPKAKVRKGPKATTARVALKASSAARWRLEVAASLKDPVVKKDSFLGGHAAWADVVDGSDPLRGEVERVKLLTFRPRKGADLVALPNAPGAATAIVAVAAAPWSGDTQAPAPEEEESIGPKTTRDTRPLTATNTHACFSHA